MNRSDRHASRPGSGLLFVVAAGALACAPAQKSQPAPGDGQARNEMSLSFDEPLKVTQTLVASLLSDAILTVPLVFEQRENLELCFGDDDGEAHTVELLRGEERLLRAVADDGCVRATVSAGSYVLHMRHANFGSAGGAVDPSPDTVHSQWLRLGDSVATSSLQLVLGVNQCVGCNLDGTDWPLVDKPQGYGYFGNYKNASFRNSRCGFYRNGSCALGLPFRSERSVFDGADFSGTTFARQETPVRIGSPSGDTSFVDTRFDGLSFTADTTLQGHFAGAHLDGVRLVPADLRGDFSGASHQGAILGGAAYVVGSIPVSIIQKLRRASGFRRGSSLTVVVEPDADLSGLSYDGEVDSLIWPVVNGRLQLHGANFFNTHLSNMTVPCPEGGDLMGAQFDNAVLRRVSLSRCNLSGATFNGASLVDVTMTSAALGDVEFQNVIIDGLNLTGSVVTGKKTLSTKPGVSARRINATDAVFEVSAPNVALVDFAAFNADLSGSVFNNAQLQGAALNRARLDDTNFTGAHLERAALNEVTANGIVLESAHLNLSTLDGAQFAGGSFVSSDFSGATFGNGSLCGGSLLGAILSAADLSGTLIPAEQATTRLGKACAAVTGRQGVVTSEATICPDATFGPCARDQQWQP